MGEPALSPPVHRDTPRSTLLHTDTIFSTEKRMLVCVTFYRPDEDGGYRKSTGGFLTDGKSVAVDPTIIPYGSKVYLPGFNEKIAEDTGSAVKSKKASKLRALKLLKSNTITHSEYEVLKNTPVVDVFVANRKEYDRLVRTTPDFLNAIIK